MRIFRSQRQPAAAGRLDRREQRAVSVVRLPGGREARLVPADKAGEFSLSVVPDGPEAWHARKLLTWRQCEALLHLSRLRRASGWRMAWQRPSGAGERDPEAEERAGLEFAALMALLAEPARGWVLCIVSTGEWPVAAPVSRVQDAADVVADRLKLAGENP